MAPRIVCPVHRWLLLALAITFAGAALTRSARAQGRPAPDSSAGVRAALSVPTADMLRAHLRFLSDDLLRGRAPGTDGAKIAAEYIAAQFEALGLEPAAARGSFHQPVTLIGVTPDPSFVIGVQRRTRALTYLDDFVAWPIEPDSPLTVDGDVVFVGHGIQAREWQWDDYKGTSVAGKILLMLVNDPGLVDSTRFLGRTMTYFGRWTYKLEQAARMGAAGAILIHTNQSAAVPWSVIRNSWSGEQIQPEQQTPQSLRFAAWITSDAARELVTEAGADYDLLMRLAQRRTFRPIPISAHAVLRIRSQIRQIRGSNIVAVIDGADPEGRREAVVFTAHYDHLGVGQPLNGDSIYNGAEDNASGVAALLATAAAFALAGPPPRRSVLFVATTAEESGFLGAEAYAAQPIVPLELTAAVINIDRINLRGVTRDAAAVGAERSTLQGYFARAAAAEGLVPAPDPNPEGGYFYRSDHLPFARAGVPVVSLRVGTNFADRPPEWGLQQEQRYIAEHYHQPSDEFRDDFQYDGALQQVRLLLRLGWELARTDEFPTWHPSSEFRPAGERLRIRRIRGGSR